MMLKKPAIAIAAALFVVGGAGSAFAHESCTGYYNQVMGAYQTMGPNSPQYNQMASDYSARCLSGASAAPAYYQAPYAYQPAYQAPYAYQTVDPGAAVIGAALVGGALAGAFDNDHHDHRDRERRW